MKKTLLSLIGLAALTVIAGAQELPTAPHLNLLQRGARLLTNPRIANELGLNEAQKGNVERIMNWLGTKETSMLESKNPDQTAIVNTDRAASDQLLHVLTVPQTQKLTKVTYREAGYAALVEPEVAQKLSLSADQVSKVHAALDAALEPTLQLEEIIAKAVANDQKHATQITARYAPERRNRAKAQKLAEAKALDVLTPTQRKSWANLSS